MFLTEKEIMEQHVALTETFQYFIENKAVIEEFFKKHNEKKFLFLGCGSSYMLAKTGQRKFAACRDTAANAIAGGDYLVNKDFYEETVKGSIVVVLSRSGQTTEIVESVKEMKKRYGNPMISISAKAANDVMPYSDLDITLDWCYDQSVSQTRTVTNLYMAILFLAAIYQEDNAMIADLFRVVLENKEYKEEYRDCLREIARRAWDNVVILADGPVIGIGEEGALAFTEIAMVPGGFFNLLDYRHGPMVLNDERTLTIVLVGPGENRLQKDMLEDLKARKCILITVSTEKENIYGADANIYIGDVKDFGVMGIPFIFIMQCLAYEKALIRGTNPDAPIGLDAFITLCKKSE